MLHVNAIVLIANLLLMQKMEVKLENTILPMLMVTIVKVHTNQPCISLLNRLSVNNVVSCCLTLMIEISHQDLLS